MKKDFTFVGCLLTAMWLWAGIHEASALVFGPLAIFTAGYWELSRQ